ncbi:prokaryotic DNA topoisomerase [Schistosoma japonicum]|nr:prokaryotic DNA topoisomerase [Schistosoma japonicum]KAH8850875.1 prokaryotic DNA topoisomerase [Schistosoma japonicum]
MFMSLMGSYGVMTIISQWLWSIMMRKKFQRRTKSIMCTFMCIFSAGVYTLLGICIVILSFIDTKHNNRIHYRLTVTSFMCHTIVIPLNTLLVVFAFRSWKWFVLARILVAIQMGLGSFFFRYFNKAGLRVLNAVNPFYIKRHEPGYEEFKWSAICEWIVVLGCVEITLITGLELRNYEKENEERSRKHVGIWTI